MAVGSSLSGIGFSGLASGIDSETIVRRLIQLESIPLQRYQTQMQQISGRMSVLNQLKTRITGLSSAAGSLNMASSFTSVMAASSKSEVATISADSTASAGIFALAVSKLAQSHKIATTAQTDTTSALGKTGTIVVNGKAVKVEASDSLQALAAKINTANSGVTASLINGGTGKAYLSLTSKDTGVANQVQISDLSGSVASDLGLASGAESYRDSSGGVVKSFGFSSATTSLSTLLGATDLGTAKFLKLNGESVAINPETDTLSSIASKINAAALGVTASVTSTTENGKTVQKLEMTGLTSYADDDNILAGLGVTQKAFGNQLVTAQDAAFTIDGVSMTSTTNTITTAVPGATITLLKASESTPETSTLSLSRDSAAIKKRITEFKDAFNGVIDFIKSNSAFNKETFASGALFGDTTAQQVEASISSLVFNSVPGLGTDPSNLAALGFAFDSDGKLTLNEATLDAAISTNAESVGRVFRSNGVATASGVSYVSSTDKTKSSATAGYAVNITQLATKTNYLSAGTLAGTTDAAETLTLSGSSFGSTPYELTIPAGKTIAEVVALINGDAKLKDLLVATNEGGALKIESKRYGTGGDFSISSSAESGGDQSGALAFGSTATKSAGVNVAGTINGKAATGLGQFLTSTEGDSEGLQLSITSTATGDLGKVVFSKGIGAQMIAMASTFTDTVNGLLTATDKSLQDQIDSITTTMSSMQEAITRKEQSLRLRFSRMEQAIAQLQSQQAQFAASS